MLWLPSTQVITDIFQDFSKLSKAKVEKYLLILSIIEENSREYQDIKGQLKSILEELKILNKQEDSDEDVDYDIEEEAENSGAQGDALSRMMRAGA